MSDITASTSGDFCNNALVYYPIDSYIPGLPSTTGLLMCIIALIYILMSFATIAWIKYQEYRARNSDSLHLVRSVIFPVFVSVLWISALASVFSGLVLFFVPINPIGSNKWEFAIAYGCRRALQHAVIEGVAFLLMQKGVGYYTAKRVLILIIFWSAIAFTVTALSVSEGLAGEALELAFDGILFIFYLTLWLAPQNKLFRRTSAIRYAQCWAIYRFLVIGVNSLYYFETTQYLGSCIYIFLSLLIFAIFQPLSLYYALLQDSKWWQGIYFTQATSNKMKSGNKRSNRQSGMSSTSARSHEPLLGSDISLASAQSLAYTLDQLRGNSDIHMVNYAQINVNWEQCLGTGSFSKVYKGTYRKSSCAVKMIFSMDLTEDIIKKIAVEASILSSIKNINVVRIIGVAVSPPSVCLLLELCDFGSLSDLIHGFGTGWNRSTRAPISISKIDRLFLALGCARGLSAVHSISAAMCHKDVKSFNFLVDSQLNAKIADLELGTADSEVSKSDINELLLNWLAPEFVRGAAYSQACDVYSLGLVIWEIISCTYPFDDLDRTEIEEKLIMGYRHDIPDEYLGSDIANLIEWSWSENPSNRPTSNQVAEVLENIYKSALLLDGVFVEKPTIQQAISFFDNELSALMKYYQGNHKKSLDKQFTATKQLSQGDLPEEIRNILVRIQTHECWKPFEACKQPWAVFLPQAPHILVYASSAWIELFLTSSISSARCVVNPQWRNDISHNDYYHNPHNPHNTSDTSDSNQKQQVYHNVFLLSLEDITLDNSQIDDLARMPSLPSPSPSSASLATMGRTGGSYSIASNSGLATSPINSAILSAPIATRINIDETFYAAKSKFLQQLSPKEIGRNSCHVGIVPISRKLGAHISGALCSLHSFTIASMEDPLKPVCIPILFNEWNEQAVAAGPSGSMSFRSFTGESLGSDRRSILESLGKLFSYHHQAGNSYSYIGNSHNHGGGSHAI